MENDECWLLPEPPSTSDEEDKQESEQVRAIEEVLGDDDSDEEARHVSSVRRRGQRIGNTIGALNQLNTLNPLSGEEIPGSPFLLDELEESTRLQVSQPRSVQLQGRDLVSEYEDFDTIDWIRDEELHRLDREAVEEECKRNPVWYNKIYREFLRSQAWIYVLLVGTMVAVFVSFVDMSLEYLGDVRYGFCRHNYFYSQASCCADNPPDQPCPTWVDWATSMGVTDLVGNPLLNWFWYCFYGVLFAGVSAWMVDCFAPRAAGSGIPELKALLGGFVIKDFISVRILFVKLFGVIFSVASGLQLGKEGPLAHIGAATVSLFDWMLPFYGANEVKRREIISAGTACGVGLAFGTPVGGVLFSLEEASYYFPHKTMWRSFFAAAIAATVLKAINPLHTGKLVSFSVDYPHGWRWFEMPFFILIGVFGGLLGKFFVATNLRICEYRKHTHLRKWPKTEVLVLAFVTAVFCYPNEFTREDAAATMAVLFNTCDVSSSKAFQSLTGDLCEPNQAWSVLIWLLMACIVRLVLTTVTSGVRVPSGLFIPSMCIGALMGRGIGIMVQQAWLANPENPFFHECSDISLNPSLNSCVIPGVYALMGGAALLAGFTRATISLVVIVFELTGNSDFIVPVMVTVIVANTVGDSLGGEGIYEEHILLNELPYLNHKRSYRFKDDTQDVMQRASQIVSLPLYGNTLHSLSRVLRRHLYSGYPVTDHGIFIGYVPYTDLKSRVDRKLEQGYDLQSVCNFDMTAPKPPSSSARSSAEPTLNAIDFADLFDRAPIQVSPHTPLRLIFHMFKSLGFRYILVVERGHLKGILTKKDILQYIALSFDKRIRTFLPSIENSGAIAHQSFASTFLSEDKLTSSSAEMRKLASVGINSLDDSV